MDTKYIVLSVVIIAVAVWGGYQLFGGNEETPQVSMVTASSTPETTSAGAASSTATSRPSADVASVTPSPSGEAGQPATNGAHKVTIETNYGTIVFQTDDADAPNTVTNFLTLASKGFYDSLTFHRVIPGFMIQGGDPKGDGTGGPGYTIAEELNPSAPSYKAGYKKGVVAMAKTQEPHSTGSQFFIMTADYPLPNEYSIFGKVISGQDVVDKIANVKADPSNNKPLSPVVMKKVTVQ